MPPKAKFCKEEIISAALCIVREDGAEALTARALGAKLGSSARPIFTVFNNMEGVERDVLSAAKALYGSYIEKGLSAPVPFKGVGEQYILFSIKEPKLFSLLFMSEQKNLPDLKTVLPIIDDNYNEILMSIQKTYKVEVELSKKLYRHMWIYCHGIATLCSTGMCSFTPGEISVMISEIFKGLMLCFKNDKEVEQND